MSHKYYGFQKQEDNLYTIPFLSTKTKRLRFLNNEFVGYGERNEFIIHKNPGLTIVRFDDNLINNGLHNRSNTTRIMTELLNQLISNSSSTSFVSATNIRKDLNVRKVTVNSASSIRITLQA